MLVAVSDPSGIRRPARPGQVRASDAEREAVIDRLRLHGGEGRLTPEELEERIDQTYAARTRGHLAEVLHDLPATGRAPVRPRGPVRRRRSPARRLVPMALVLVALAAAAGGPGEGRADRDASTAPPGAVSDAATRAVGGGAVTEAEPSDEGGWEVEVQRGDEEVDVLLDRNLDVIEVD